MPKRKKSGPRVDPTALVADGARLADDVEVGPYCIVGREVELKSGVRLMSHAVVSGITAIGERTVVYPFVSLGGVPQSTAYRGEPTRLVIGSDCQFREGVTVSVGTVGGGGLTTIGDRCFMMAGSHVGHDCTVGDDVMFANNAVLGGHVIVGSAVFLGGQAAIHQFVRIGDGVMVAGMSGVTKDIVPFGFAMGSTVAQIVGLNVVGLRRRGHSRDDIRRLRRAYRSLFDGTQTFAERLAATEREFGGDPLVGRVLDFIRAKRSRPLMMTTADAAEGADDGI